MPCVAKVSSVVFSLLMLSCVRLTSGFNDEECECGVNDIISKRIMGGWNVRPHKFPWLVSVGFEHYARCGGALINNLYVLTAGHCVDETPISELTIVVGQHNSRPSDGKQLPVSKIIMHKDYHIHVSYDDYDIALIRLRSSVTFTHRVSPICLPQTGATFYNAMATVTGWGALKDGKPHANRLLQTAVRILPDWECAKTSMKPYINDHVICAYAKRRDSCQGDSGGPLIYEFEPGKWVIVGVISWGTGCVNNNIPGMYTKVTYFLDWIYDNTKDAYYCWDTYYDTFSP